MKLAITSRVLDFLGHKFVGSASAMFGLPAGALSDLYWMHGDRPAPEPGDAEKPEWMRRRVFENYIRRQLSLRVGMLASALAMTIVVVGLLFLGATAGVQHEWASHEAKVAQAHAEEVQQAQQVAQQKLQAQLAALPDSVRPAVSAMGDHCQQLVSDARADKSTPWIKNAGCDPSTGILDVSRAAAFEARLQAEQKSLLATLAAPGTKNAALIGSFGADCIAVAAGGTNEMSGTNEVVDHGSVHTVSTAAFAGCDPSTGRLDPAKAQAFAKYMGGQ